MRTFNQMFKEFNTDFSCSELFLKRTYSDESLKLFKKIAIPCSVLVGLGCAFMNFQSMTIIAMSLIFIGSLPIIIYAFIINTYKARKELKSQGLPLPQGIPQNWFKWESPELTDVRITHIYNNYERQTIINKDIERVIAIAEKEKNEPIRDPFILFEKFLEYFGKTFIGVLIGLLIAELNRGFSVENFNSTLRLILVILIMSGLFVFIWRFMFKRVYFEDSLSRKKKLKDFIFVLNNILLLRMQNRKNNELSNRNRQRN